MILFGMADLRRCTPCRQRRGKDESRKSMAAAVDALRAGSAEAKKRAAALMLTLCARCTPCRQRRGKAPNRTNIAYRVARCTPCRQRRGKVEDCHQRDPPLSMHSVQAAPRQSWRRSVLHHRVRRCTPCRQRRGKDSVETVAQPTVDDALRAGSAEAKAHQRKRDRRPMVISTTVRRFSYLPPPESPRLCPHPPSLCTIQSPSF